ncbi:NrtA/SsuA/CpmA family ABC transporter substrate-binding protein [Thermobifida cellulosilytica]|uniref:NrtA/SsuA/CpmA family ABC transporter substrate-binding protein n=1 Tax=Thermobifida cellulosilytica TaxID=144786 RepID=UPI0008395C3C|nr:NrtA/SsuA/CpmA family ABC transporter substrate-binding protein [Thermobifida cellulosilytica]
MNPFTRSAAALTLLTAALALTACGPEEESPSGGAVIRIGDPGNVGPLAYAKREGIFEDRLAEVGATIEWGGSYASFTAASDALKSGDLNVQQGAVSPAVGSLASTDDLRIFIVADLVGDPAPLRDGLVVPPDSDIRTVADLKGRRVAVNQAGKGEYLLLRALEAEGVDPDEVERVYLNPQEGAAAFASGKVDAWWAIVDAYPEAVANGARTVVTSRDIDDADLNVFVARKDLLEEHPEAAEVFFEVLNELIEEGRSRPEKFQNVFLDQGPTALDGDRLAESVELTRAATSYRYPTEEDLARIESVAATFVDHGLLDGPVNASDIVFDLPAALD